MEAFFVGVVLDLFGGGGLVGVVLDLFGEGGLVGVVLDLLGKRGSVGAVSDLLGERGLAGGAPWGIWEVLLLGVLGDNGLLFTPGDVSGVV